MSIKTDLKKEGIEILKPLDTLSVISIAKTVATKLVIAFPEQNLSCSDVFMRLSKLDMYIAKLPTGLSSAKYYYKNSSIYFSDDIDFSTIDTYALHECIHFLQELKDTKNNLIHLGLCDFTKPRLPGMALNEAAVQLMSARAQNQPIDTVKYFNISFPTNSPYYYALECNLLTQMAYITGDYALFNSTLYSNNSFKNKFISQTNRSSYYKIQDNMDRLMDFEDLLSAEASKLEMSDIPIKTIAKIEEKIATLRNNIKDLFLKTQNLILTSYFDTNYKAIDTLEQVENYRRKLYNYKDLIGTTDGYTYFNNYYIKKMAQLEEKCAQLESQFIPNDKALVPIKNNLFTIIINKIKKLFGFTMEYEKNI